MSLLREIQNAAVSETADIATILRKCRILASRLKHEDLKKWVQYELDGYPTQDDVPDYRIMSCESCGHFSGFYGSGLRNAPIPMNCLPKEWRELMSKVHFLEGVSELRDLVNNTEDGTLQQMWLADLYPVVGRKIYQNMNLMQAWKIIPKSAIVGILDTVRNKVLNFALEIESANPDAGEAASTTEPPVPAATVQQIFNNYISGSVGNIASASPHSQQHATVTVRNNDFKSLESFLSSVGIGVEDIDALKKAVENDPKIENGHFGKRVAAWIGKMVSKAAQGTLKIGVEVASTVLTQALKGYFGLH